MPIHPLHGLALNVVSTRRDRVGRRLLVVAEVPAGGRIVLPVEWTDRGPPWTVSSLDGRQVRLDAAGLRALAEVVYAVMREKLDLSSSPGSGSAYAEQTSTQVERSSGHPRGGMGRGALDGAERPARGLGKPDGPQRRL